MATDGTVAQDAPAKREDTERKSGTASLNGDHGDLHALAHGIRDGLVLDSLIPVFDLGLSHVGLEMVLLG